MSSPQKGSHDPDTAPERVPSVVLVCETCDHIWEPSPADRAAGPVPRTKCDGWTMIGELAELDSATAYRPVRTCCTASADGSLTMITTELSLES